MFDYQLLEGDPKTVLKNPNSLVLSESTAKKYFGDYRAVGNLITVGNDETYEVTGIVADPPHHSHLSFDVLASISSLPDDQSQNWVSRHLYTYVLLHEGTQPKVVTDKLNTLIEKYVYAFCPHLMIITGFH